MAEYTIQARRLTNITVTLLAFASGVPVTGLLPTNVLVVFIHPGVAPANLTVDGTNFRELGGGVYEFDLAGSNLDIEGIYGLTLQPSGVPTFDLYQIVLQVQGSTQSLLEKVFGFGILPLDETFGGTGPDPKPLQIISGGQPLDFVRFYLFLVSDWDAGNRDIATFSKGIGESDQNGDWKWPILAEPEDYILLADTSANTLFELTEIKRFTVAVPTVAPQPTITLITPNTGPDTGGTLIIINGTEFVDGATVDVDGNPATSVSFISATEIRAITPAGTAGAVDVVVTNPDTQFGRSPGGFTYI